MKWVKRICCMVCFVSGFSSISAQKLTTGLMTGPNFSNIRGNNSSGKWESKVSLSSAIWLNYAFTPVFSIGAEANYTSLSYQHKGYPAIQQADDPNDRPILVAGRENWSFDFLRFPLYMKFSTPTKLRFDFLVGAYYSLLLQHSEKENDYSENLIIYDYPKKEFGGLIGIGFSYPVTNKIELMVQGRYLFGSKEYIPYNKGKNGDFELMLGIGYSLFNKMTVNYPSFSDADDYRFSLKYRAGFNASWIKTNDRQESYTYDFGISSGIAANYLLGENVAIQFEVLFENKGYQMADSSYTYYKYTAPPAYSGNYYADTKTQISYLTIPLLLQFSTKEEPVTLFANTGFYYSGRLKAKTVGSATKVVKQVDGSQVSFNENTTDDLYDNIEGLIKPYDLGWIVGGGVQISLKNYWKIDIEGRYQQGWTNILKQQVYTATGENQSMKNRTISILLGLQIPIR